MGPSFGSPKYLTQIDTIVQCISSIKDLKPEELNKFLMMYILDKSYSRAAIAEAESILRKRLTVDC